MCFSINIALYFCITQTYFLVVLLNAVVVCPALGVTGPVIGVCSRTDAPTITPLAQEPMKSS